MANVTLQMYTSSLSTLRIKFRLFHDLNDFEQDYNESVLLFVSGLGYATIIYIKAKPRNVGVTLEGH